MDNLLSSFGIWFWVLVLLMALVLHRWVLRFLFGMVIVPENRIGLVTKKFELFGKDKQQIGRASCRERVCSTV